MEICFKGHPTASIRVAFGELDLKITLPLNHEILSQIERSLITYIISRDLQTTRCIISKRYVTVF
jgi:hypothetical protein